MVYYSLYLEIFLNLQTQLIYYFWFLSLGWYGSYGLESVHRGTKADLESVLFPH